MSARRVSLLILVLSLLLAAYGCTSSDSALPGASASSAAAGTATISLVGGEGTTGFGGSGNNIYVNNYADVKFLTTGSVDASFSIPPTPTAKFGSKPLVISANTTINVLNSVAPEDWTGLASGTPYMVNGASSIFISNGTAHDASTAITGLKVNAGATLTLGLNGSWYNNSGLDIADLDFSDDVEILGAVIINSLDTGGLGGLRTVDNRHGATATSRDKGLLEIEANRLILGSSSLLDASGADATAADTRGGDGGAVWLYGYDGGVYILGGRINADGGDGLGTGIGGYAATYSDNAIDGVYIWSDGNLVNKATISANGGTGATGGGAGYIELDSDGNGYNTGNLTASGGTATAGNGGSASSIYMYSYYASVYNSGNLTGNGGNGGGTGGGGGGASIEFYAAYYGWFQRTSGQVRNSGNLTANGGDSGAAGGGGGAGYFYFESYGGDIRTSGAIAGNGGSGAGAGNSGGSGSGMDVYVYAGSDYGYGEITTPGLVQVAGNISLSGGSGPDGGSAGYVNVYNDDYNSESFPPAQNTEFIGYASVDLSGGDGVTSGGVGGDSTIYTDTAWHGEYSDAYATGAIINELAWKSTGGAASGAIGEGGGGGDFYWEAEGSEYIGSTVVRNSGAIDVSGGDATGTGANSGGNSGSVFLFGRDKVENSGAIAANGGDADGAGGTGGWGAFGDGYGVEFYSSVDIVSTGGITAMGGGATAGIGADGGRGGNYVGMIAGRTVTAGAINANGGDADDVGGGGGYVDLFSQVGPTSTTATITAAGGAGATDGAEGDIWVDWSMVN